MKKIIKTVVFTLFIFVFLKCNNCNNCNTYNNYNNYDKTNKYNVRIQLKLKEKTKRPDYIPKSKSIGVYYFTNIEITNNNDTAFTFCALKKLSDEIFITNSNCISMCNPIIVDGLGIIDHKINPKETLILPTIVNIISDYKYIKNMDLRIGLIYVNEKEHKRINAELDTIDYSKEQFSGFILWNKFSRLIMSKSENITTKSIIWSDPIIFKQY